MSEFCPECGWSHANVNKCWRKTIREAQEKVVDPTLPTDLRERLQLAINSFKDYQRETVAFFQAANADSE